MLVTPLPVFPLLVGLELGKGTIGRVPLLRHPFSVSAVFAVIPGMVFFAVAVVVPFLISVPFVVIREFVGLILVLLEIGGGPDPQR